MSFSNDKLLNGTAHSPNYGAKECDVVIFSKSGISKDSSPPPPIITSSSCTSSGSNREWVVAVCSLTACLASIVNGMVLGFSSPALTQLQFNVSEEYRINDDDVKFSLFAALSHIGAMFGSLISWPVSDLLGRKTSLMLSGLPALVGWLMIALAHLIPSSVQGFYGVLLSGRIMTGVYLGWSVVGVAVYISEISSAKLKGLFGNCNELFIAIGVFLSFFFGIEYKLSDGRYVGLTYWQIALIAVGILIIFEVLIVFTYESPRWLLMKQNEKKAIKTLKALRGPNFPISKELEAIKASVQQTYSVMGQLMEFHHRSVYIPFLLVTTLIFFECHGGINVAYFYASHVFIEAGISERHVNLVAAVSVGVVHIFATLVSIFFVDLLGRKILLNVSSVGMALSCLVLGIYFYMYNSVCENCLVGDPTCNLSIFNDSIHQYFPCNTNNFGYLAVACIITLVISYSVGWGPTVWTAMSELMPNRVRSLAGSITTLINWIFDFVFTFCFKYYSRPPINNDGAWWTFCSIMVVAVIFVVLFLPETKGHSLEEIQEHFEKGHIFAVSCGSSSSRRSRRIITQLIPPTSSNYDSDE